MMAARRIDTLDDLREGLDWLIGQEPRFGPIAAVAGDPPLRRGESGFPGLCRTIIAQQVSVASARAIWSRFSEAFAQPTPEAVLAAGEDRLRACGLSGPKIRALAAAAKAIDEGSLDLARLGEADAETVHRALTAVSGVGPWTADIYMMFSLGHADAFAPGDLALQEAARIGFNLPSRPDPKALTRIALPWSPWRAAAASLLWKYYHQVKTREGAPV